MGYKIDNVQTYREGVFEFGCAGLAKSWGVSEAKVKSAFDRAKKIVRPKKKDDYDYLTSIAKNMLKIS